MAYHVLMIVVRVELHSAITGEVTEIGTTVISNAAVYEGGSRGDYNVGVAGRKYSTSGKGVVNALGLSGEPLRTGSVENYPRRSYNVWRLVSRALRSAFPEEG